ncbi:type II secretion system protein [Campylobacter sp. MIT 99-7217]|uniref:type II secretion system protein n=1 Tax=Campylobacter sp. MIT 99-7217 TaxID=535091 RepID=UPI00163C6567|nr:type II secretion system protein [Campylobacter sp. MIT 99-7217]
MLELVFVFIILGVLASIAFSYFHFTQSNAKLIKLKSDVELIKSALAYAQNDFYLKNINANVNVLDEAKIDLENEKLFFCSNAQIQNCKTTQCCNASLLASPIFSSKKAWIKTSNYGYRFYLSAKNFIDFVYKPSDMSFECLNSALCKELL